MSQTHGGAREPSRGRARRLPGVATYIVLGLLASTPAAADKGATLARLEVLLGARDLPASCQPLPPTPNPDHPAEPLVQCIGTRDDAQIAAMRTTDGRAVWLDYTGPWLRGAAGTEQWERMLATLERAFGESRGPRAQCRLWTRDDGVVRAVLLGSSDADDGVIRLFRVSVTGADTQDALGC